MKIWKSFLSLFGVLVLFSFCPASGAEWTWLEVESQYLGNGWFRYRIGSLGLPTIESINIGSFSPGVSAGNTWLDRRAAPVGWSCVTNAPDSGGWAVNVQYPHWQVTPYRAVFEARSGWTNFTQGRATLTMSLSLYELRGYTPYASGNIVGYWSAPALVPCLEPATNVVPAYLYSSRVETNTDIQIDTLIREGQRTKGILFTYGTAATFVLEATADFENWRKLSYIHGVNGTNRWTTDADLDQEGSFYRLAYIAYGHLPLTSLPPLGLAPTLQAGVPIAGQPAPLPLSACFKDQQFQVRFPTIPGNNYEVRVYELGKVVWSKRLVAQQSEAVVALPSEEVPEAGFAAAYRMP